MGKIEHQEAYQVILRGGIVREVHLKDVDGNEIETGDRYYRYNQTTGKLQYSDYVATRWKDSNLTLEKFKELPDAGLWREIK